MTRRVRMALARVAAWIPSSEFRRCFLLAAFEHDRTSLLAALGPTFNRDPTLGAVPLDLSGLIASNSFNHGLIDALDVAAALA